MNLVWCCLRYMNIRNFFEKLFMLFQLLAIFSLKYDKIRVKGIRKMSLIIRVSPSHLTPPVIWVVLLDASAERILYRKFFNRCLSCIYFLKFCSSLVFKPGFYYMKVRIFMFLSVFYGRVYGSSNPASREVYTIHCKLY